MSKNVLLIAGLDPSGGAGLVADVQTVRACGLRPVGAVTALTEQDTNGVRALNPVNPEVLAAQLTTLLTDIEISAVKIGMIANEAIAKVIGDALALTNAPVVWDPVGRAGHGGAPLFEGSWDRAIECLIGHVSVITPNHGEVLALAGIDDASVGEPELVTAAAAVAARAKCDVIVTGGHGDDASQIHDLVIGAQGLVTTLSHARLDGGTAVHGTGCAMSTVLACALADGASLSDAVRRAQAFVAAAIAVAPSPGRGAAAIW